MIPVRPDSTGGAIEEYSIQPLLPKGISIGKDNGVISGQASDTLSPTKFVVTATGPGGRASDTLLFRSELLDLIMVYLAHSHLKRAQPN